VEILTLFWTFTGIIAGNGIVPPLLIYAGSMATDDARANEVAQIIFDN
jgi:hypothetical protein